ncbi:hypothetical protein FHS77_001056 [Paenochrobactrum gallinarii]|uniref:Uncharacterized protein n=1 Tax=Paenochrobactrum gallinarii TaxID=643673 RepID=A0A841LVF0_9HYPH|nr:hypothetical protein [Paenochrobactrum gallinarii]
MPSDILLTTDILVIITICLSVIYLTCRHFFL